MTIDEQALQRLLDKEAIREASLRYTRGIDRHDDALMAQAYHPGAVDDHGSYIGEPEGFIRHAKDSHKQHWDIHQHFVTNQTIDLDGDTAHVETYFLAALRRKSGGEVDMVGGRYVDRWTRHDGEWAIERRACLVEWSGELAPAGTTMDPNLFLHGTWDRQDASYMRPLELDRPHRELAP